MMEKIRNFECWQNCSTVSVSRYCKLRTGIIPIFLASLTLQLIAQCERTFSLILMWCILLTFLLPTVGTSDACWSWTCRLESSWTDRGRREGTGWTAWTGTSAGSATSASDARTFGAASQGPLFSIEEKSFLLPRNKHLKNCSRFSTMVCASSSQPWINAVNQWQAFSAKLREISFLTAWQIYLYAWKFPLVVQQIDFRRLCLLPCFSSSCCFSIDEMASCTGSEPICASISSSCA